MVERLLVIITHKKTVGKGDKSGDVQLVSSRGEIFEQNTIYDMMCLGYDFVIQVGDHPVTRIESAHYKYKHPDGYIIYAFYLRSQRDETPDNNLKHLPEWNGK